MTWIVAECWVLVCAEPAIHRSESAKPVRIHSLIQTSLSRLPSSCLEESTKNATHRTQRQILLSGLRQLTVRRFHLSGENPVNCVEHRQNRAFNTVGAHSDPTIGLAFVLDF